MELLTAQCKMPWPINEQVSQCPGVVYTELLQPLTINTNIEYHMDPRLYPGSKDEPILLIDWSHCRGIAAHQLPPTKYSTPDKHIMQMIG